MSTIPGLNIDRLRELLGNDRFNELLENGRFPGSGAPGRGDTYQAGDKPVGPFVPTRPVPQPLSLGSADADDVAVRALIQVIQDQGLLEAALSGNKRNIRNTVDGAANKALALLAEAFDLKRPNLIRGELRRTIRRAVIDMQQGKSPLDSLSASLRHTSNFSMTTIDPAQEPTRPAVDFDEAVNLGNDSNTEVLRGVAGVLRGETEISVGDSKGKIGDLIDEARAAGDREAYVATVEAATQKIIEEVTRTGGMPTDEDEAEKVATAIRQVLFSSLGYRSGGVEIDEALARALNDSRHFPIVAETPDDDGSDPLGFDDSGVEAARDAISEVLSGTTALDGHIEGVEGSFAEALARASAAGDSDAYVNTVEAAARAILARLEEQGLVVEDKKSLLKTAIVQVLFEAGAALNQGATVEDALAGALEQTGHLAIDDSIEQEGE